MAKISRSPYHGSRYVKRVFNQDTDVRFVHSGDALFIDVPVGGMSLNFGYTHEGCYNKMIIRESLGDLTINFTNKVSGMMLFDLGGQNDTVQSHAADLASAVVIPAGASDGSIIELICDGSTWYIQGLVHGSEVTSS
jgi:hypothetical protein